MLAVPGWDAALGRGSFAGLAPGIMFGLGLGVASPPFAHGIAMLGVAPCSRTEILREQAGSRSQGTPLRFRTDAGRAFGRLERLRQPQLRVCRADGSEVRSGCTSGAGGGGPLWHGRAPHEGRGNLRGVRGDFGRLAADGEPDGPPAWRMAGSAIGRPWLATPIAAVIVLATRAG
jgi:hypothetical protein